MNANVTRQRATHARARGRRAAQSSCPKTPIDAAIIQYTRGGFSRYATPSRRAVTQSPDFSIFTAICACTASTSSMRRGGLMILARNTRDANTATRIPLLRAARRASPHAAVPLRCSTVSSTAVVSSIPISDSQGSSLERNAAITLGRPQSSGTGLQT